MTDHYEMPHARADECPHAGVGKACRPCRDRFERAPITPDERAAMRETIATLDAAWEADDPARPLVTEHATLTLLAHVASAVPRLLDALDTAEAEVARLLAERTAAHADDATCASCTHEYVADVEKHAEDAEEKVARQRDRLRAREEQVRRLRAEVTRLHALVADLRAAPVCDEDTVTEAVVRALRARLPLTPEHEFDATAYAQAHAALAVVREHLPVSGESRATVQAEALAAWKAANSTVVEAVALLGGTFGESLREALAIDPKGK